MMNGLIKRVAERASHQSPDGYPIIIPYNNDFTEKLTELILTEVISTIYASDISDKKQEKLVNGLAHKFGMK